MTPPTPDELPAAITAAQATISLLVTIISCTLAVGLSTSAVCIYRFILRTVPLNRKATS